MELILPGLCQRRGRVVAGSVSSVICQHLAGPRRPARIFEPRDRVNEIRDETNKAALTPALIARPRVNTDLSAHHQAGTVRTNSAAAAAVVGVLLSLLLLLLLLLMLSRRLLLLPPCPGRVRS